MCLIQNLEFKIQNFGFADSSVTRFARATSSTLEEELDKYKNVIPQNRLSILIGISNENILLETPILAFAGSVE